MTVREQVRTFIIDSFLFGQPNGISDTTSFLETGVVSSTGILELVVFIETTFGLRVMDEEVVPDNLDSIEQITIYIESKRRLNAVMEHAPVGYC